MTDPIIELIVAEERKNMSEEPVASDDETSIDFRTDDELSDGKESIESEGLREIDETIADDNEEDQLIFAEEDDVELSGGTWYSPRSGNLVGETDKFPVEADGELDNFLVVVNSPQFEVRVQIDDNLVVNDTFNDLQTFSNSLSNVSAYTSGDNHVVNVSNYPFKEYLDVGVRPLDSITLKKIRVEGRV